MSAIVRSSVVAAAEPARLAAQPSRTDLPAARTVSEPAPVDIDLDDAARRRAGIESALDRPPATERDFVADRDSGALVFRVTRQPGDTVVLQIPSDELLKLRAYAREGDEEMAEHDVTA